MLLPYLNKDLIEAGCDEAGRGYVWQDLYMQLLLFSLSILRMNC